MVDVSGCAFAIKAFDSNKQATNWNRIRICISMEKKPLDEQKNWILFPFWKTGERKMHPTHFFFSVSLFALYYKISNELQF